MAHQTERIVTGSVLGEAVFEHPEFRYRKPIIVPFDVFNFDPERLRATDEYPRGWNPPSLQPVPAVDLVDYSVSFGDEEPTGLCRAQMTLLPNEGTAARNPKAVLDVWVNHSATEDRESMGFLVKKMLDIAFRLWASRS